MNASDLSDVSRHQLQSSGQSVAAAAAEERAMSTFLALFSFRVRARSGMLRCRVIGQNVRARSADDVCVCVCARACVCVCACVAVRVVTAGIRPNRMKGSR